MKRFLIALTACFTVIIFVSATAPAKEQEEEKSKVQKSMKASGTVMEYEANNMITVKEADGEELAFDISPSAKVKGDITKGVEVKVRYKKKGEKLIATSIRVAAEKAKPETETSSGE